MSDYGVAEIMRLAAWLRFLLYWAGKAPWEREPFVEEEWL